MQRLAILLLCLVAGAAASSRELTARNPCKGKRDGALVAAGSCSPKYNECQRGRPLPTQACPAGQVFNPATRPLGCSFIGAVGVTDCNCNYFRGDERKACQVCQSKQRDGNFKLPGSSRKFVECSVQGAFVLACNDGLRWNDKRKNCL